MNLSALLDSNVIIAAVAEAHEHHEPSLALFNTGEAPRLAVAAHSFAEVYSQLTRLSGPAPFAFTPREALAALDGVRDVTDLVGLTPSRTYDAIRDYAKGGGIGARLYDRLIGETAVAEGIGAIITWNVGHMSGLFPSLRVLTPMNFAQQI